MAGVRSSNEQSYIITALVEHRPGVLFRVSNLFRRRNFNIENITVGTVDPTTARMTIVIKGDEKVVEQVVKQLNKLVDVVRVSTLDPENSVIRELALVKVHAPNSTARGDIVQFAEVFRGRVVDASRESLIVEITGTPDKIDAFIDLMKTYGIKELARTGITAMMRGPKTVPG